MHGRWAAIRPARGEDIALAAPPGGGAADIFFSRFDHDGGFAFALRVCFLDSTALIVRFNFRAIRALSIFKASNAKSCTSSARVQGRPVGRGPSLIFPSPSARPANVARLGPSVTAAFNVKSQRFAEP